MFFDPMYFIFLAPALLLMMWAQYRLRATYAQAMQMPAPLSGAAAARHILDQAGLHNVGVEEVPGQLSDHYDPSAKVLRLSSEVYHNHSIAAVGIAAHEAGHALQDAKNYAPLGLRNLAVPAAQYGPGLAMVLFIVGSLFASGGNMFMGRQLIIVGLVAFSSVLVFQIINLPVEYDASARAKRVLAELQIVRDPQGAAMVNSMLGAAALTYVAGMLQSLLTLLYYIFRFSGILRSGSDDR